MPIANFVHGSYDPKCLPRKGQTFRFDYPQEFVTLPEYTAHAGQTVTILRRLTLNENQSGVPMFRVAAADGWQGDAWADELTTV